MTITLSQIVALLAVVLPMVATIIACALKIGRAYGREESARATYESQVGELRASLAKMNRRVQIIEDMTERLASGTGRHRLEGPRGGGRG